MVGHGLVEHRSLTDRMMQARRRILVLDDDPTGSQTAAGVPIATDFSAESIEWVLREAAPTGFVLTNSRALDAVTARELIGEITRTATEAADHLGLDLSIVSRSDSTLRGHFPLEVDALAAATEGAPAVVVLCPAYPAAGRITRDGLHLVRAGTEWIPVGETAYAGDATFGFTSSTLPDWIEERTHGRWPAREIRVLTLADIRGGGPTGIARIIGEAAAARPPMPVCVDAETEADLDIVAAGLELCEEDGVRTLVRCGPSLARARGGLPHSVRASRHSLRSALDRATGDHGLVVAGSHVALTTAQLAHLDTLADITTVELPTTELLDPTRRQDAVDEAVRRSVDALRECDVVLRTGRTVQVGHDGADSLRIAAAVASALRSAAAAIVATTSPRWLVAKGGITSADVVTDVLRMRRAKVLGPLLDGIVPVWVDESASGPLCVVFPGNVGGPESLREAVTLLRELD
ncbi:four-carbon acid sugar kinase family protein [Rhodococcus wratislaviensis]|uniref:four-carbon acid sugar kinase family protein n=1 Tax=Rhodococcus wratislaviensis TaxID=44752 RepID=UPI00351309E9